jgi:hypothetical protein
MLQMEEVPDNVLQRSAFASSFNFESDTDSSSDDSDSDIEAELVLLYDHVLAVAGSERTYTYRQPYYVKPRLMRSILSRVGPDGCWSDSDFLSNLRVSRSMVQMLDERLAPWLVRQPTNMKPDPITPTEQVYIGLSYLATGATFKALHRETNWSVPTVQRAVNAFCTAMYHEFAEEVIRFPQGKHLVCCSSSTATHPPLQ